MSGFRLLGYARCGGSSENLGQQAARLLLFAFAECGERGTRVDAGEETVPDPLARFGQDEGTDLLQQSTSSVA